MRTILLGPPGCGKGTQGDLIERSYGFPRISTGDLLRQAVRDKTPLGLEADKAMRSGDLVRDDLVLGLVRERIGRADAAAGYILDGYPRTLVQAADVEALDPDRPEIVIAIDVAEDELVMRLSQRRACLGCGAVYNLSAKPPLRDNRCDVCGTALVQREDDRPEVIRERLRVYSEKTAPLLAHYRRKNNLHRVDGSAGMEATFAAIRTVLDAALKVIGKMDARA